MYSLRRIVAILSFEFLHLRPFVRPTERVFALIHRRHCTACTSSGEDS